MHATETAALVLRFARRKPLVSVIALLAANTMHVAANSLVATNCADDSGGSLRNAIAFAASGDSRSPAIDAGVNNAGLGADQRGSGFDRHSGCAPISAHSRCNKPI
ncbi:MAG TPA: hypothetical protein VN599_08420 [Rudaea sp.]|nr:hypothetical protein [Rudaea sp.]